MKIERHSFLNSLKAKPSTKLQKLHKTVKFVVSVLDFTLKSKIGCAKK